MCITRATCRFCNAPEAKSTLVHVISDIQLLSNKTSCSRQCLGSHSGSTSRDWLSAGLPVDRDCDALMISRYHGPSWRLLVHGTCEEGVRVKIENRARNARERSADDPPTLVCFQLETKTAWPPLTVLHSQQRKEELCSHDTRLYCILALVVLDVDE